MVFLTNDSSMLASDIPVPSSVTRSLIILSKEDDSRNSDQPCSTTGPTRSPRRAAAPEMPPVPPQTSTTCQTSGKRSSTGEGRSRKPCRGLFQLQGQGNTESVQARLWPAPPLLWLAARWAQLNHDGPDQHTVRRWVCGHAWGELGVIALLEKTHACFFNFHFYFLIFVNVFPMPARWRPP